jgi:hypothetical protein
MNIDYTLWPNTDGNLGNIKVKVPTGSGNNQWPEGDTLLGNFVYKDGKLVGFVDTKALIPNDSRSTIINYEYVNITVPFAENEMVFNRGGRNKYFYVKFNNEINLPIEIVEGGPWIPDASRWNQEIFQKNKELKIVRVENNVAYTE